MTDVIDTMKLRLRVHRLVEEWKGPRKLDQGGYDYLCWLLDRPRDGFETWDDNDERTFKLLAGPYGHTIYRALLARKDDEFVLAITLPIGQRKTKQN